MIFFTQTFDGDVDCGRPSGAGVRVQIKGYPKEGIERGSQPVQRSRGIYSPSAIVHCKASVVGGGGGRGGHY